MANDRCTRVEQYSQFRSDKQSAFCLRRESVMDQTPNCAQLRMPNGLNVQPVITGAPGAPSHHTQDEQVEIRLIDIVKELRTKVKELEAKVSSIDALRMDLSLLRTEFTTLKKNMAEPDYNKDPFY